MEEEEEDDDDDDDDEFSQNTDVGWEETDKWRDILQNALEEEESMARQSLYAMELAARREDCEWEWCVQSHLKGCAYTDSDSHLHQQQNEQQKQQQQQPEPLLLSMKEQRCRDAMLREIERLTRLKAAVRHEMHEMRLQGITRENALRQQLEALRIESVRLEEQRQTYTTLDECGETALEKEKVVWWRTFQLLEACLRVDA
ncbi:trichohyalin, partial [Trypanosoma theileri]